MFNKNKILTTPIVMFKIPIVKYWRNKQTFKAALNKWNTRKLAKALNLVSTAELTCKKTGVPDETVASRTALSIASAANKK